MNQMQIALLLRGALEELDATSPIEVLTGNITTAADEAVMTILVKGVEYTITVTKGDRQ